MIRLLNLTLQRGPQRLLEGAELTLHAGQKVGLIGANGAGKSSLFALLRGELGPDAGDCLLPADWRIAHMRQEVDNLERLATDYVLDGDTQLRAIQAALSKAEAAHDGSAIARLHTELDNAQGYTADARARKLLAGLGFTAEQMDKRVGDFSGGWRMRLNLAQALMCPSELLLLDEPTNHLDLDAILWLEEWLKSYPGTLLLISHDRDFLDAVVDNVAHLEQQKLTLYRGGYSAFERTRAERLAQQQQAYEKQQAQRAHMEKYIARFKAQATKARQAQSRIKALERLEELAPAHVDSPFDFVFREADKISSPLLDVAEGQLGYGDKVVLQQVKLQLVPGARIGLLGPNGAGKSTLINMMGGFLAPSAGAVTLDGATVWRNEQVYRHIGIVPEREAMYDFLTAREFVVANAELHGLADPGAAAQRALATVEMEFAQDRAVSTYSKGMRQRAKMASALVHDPSVLLLDEPFNGMDPRQRLHLMDLLRRMGAEGRTVLFSSHILEEVEQLASHIEVVVAGRHAASGDFRKIRRLMTDRPHRYLVRSSDDRALAAALIADGSTAAIELDWKERALRIQAIDFAGFTELLPRVARERGIRLYTVSPSDESLESVFSYLVTA